MSASFRSVRAGATAAVLAAAMLAACTSADAPMGPAGPQPWAAKQPTGGTVSVALAISPGAVTGGSAAQGTVTLGRAASGKGTVVSLASGDPATAGVPATVTVAKGRTSATFPIATSPVAATRSVVITASAGGSSASASVTIVAPALAGVSLSPTTLGVGEFGSGTVTIGGPAAENTTVTLVSSSTAATVSPSVTILAGHTSASFETQGLTRAPSVTITATLGAISRSATLTVQ